jgi:hypothetical protein
MEKQGIWIWQFLICQKKLEISGEFRGDTLFASYTFIQGGYKEKHIKINGILKRGDDLILGNGEIQITLGLHILLMAAIDFDRVKYKFTAVECVDEKINKWMG